MILCRFTVLLLDIQNSVSRLNFFGSDWCSCSQHSFLIRSLVIARECILNIYRAIVMIISKESSYKWLFLRRALIELDLNQIQRILRYRGYNVNILPASHVCKSITAYLYKNKSVKLLVRFPSYYLNEKIVLIIFFYSFRQTILPSNLSDLKQLKSNSQEVLEDTMSCNHNTMAIVIMNEIKPSDTKTYTLFLSAIPKRITLESNRNYHIQNDNTILSLAMMNGRHLISHFYITEKQKLQNLHYFYSLKSLPCFIQNYVSVFYLTVSIYLPCYKSILGT